MLPGTRFYYDRNGRYRGKASNYGPITQGFWFLIILGLVGYVAFQWLAENWWFFALIVAGGALVSAVIGFPIAIAYGRRTDGIVLLAVVAFIATGALVMFELIPDMNRHTSEPVEDHKAVSKQDRDWHPSRLDSDTDISRTSPQVDGKNSGRSYAAAPQPDPARSSDATRDTAPAPLISERVLPSFNCAMAAQEAERIVCGDNELSKLDREVNDLYRQVLSEAVTPYTYRQAQRNWMYYRRNACLTRECLADAYAQRRDELSRLLGN
jgi:uncharacterized protein YecT (DUF1311 family)/uncharacterized membrane protein YeaQ/YmgE (transglycosylase-associated protein family)